MDQKINIYQLYLLSGKFEKQANQVSIYLLTYRVTVSCKESVSHSVVSDSLQPHGL